jgi:hypothetical protein
MTLDNTSSMIETSLCTPMLFNVITIDEHRPARIDANVAMQSLAARFDVRAATAAEAASLGSASLASVRAAHTRTPSSVCPHVLRGCRCHGIVQPPLLVLALASPYEQRCFAKQALLTDPRIGVLQVPSLGDERAAAYYAGVNTAWNVSMNIAQQKARRSAWDV